MEDKLSTALTLGRTSFLIHFPMLISTLTMEKEYEPSKYPCPLLDQVSTALTLCDPTWNYNTNKRKADELLDAAWPRKLPSVLTSPTFEKMSTTKYRNKELKKKKRDQVVGLETAPSLRPREPWKIRKKLTKSDLKKCSRLLVPKDAVMNHVLPYLDCKSCDKVNSEEGLRVTVEDRDTDTRHELIFKFWSSTKCYVLNGDWRRVFVHGRSLKEKDEIGLYWDASRAMFMFSVLERDNPIGQFPPA